MSSSILALALVASVSATTELNGKTFDDAIAGKGVSPSQPVTFLTLQPVGSACTID